MLVDVDSVRILAKTLKLNTVTCKALPCSNLSVRHTELQGTIYVLHAAY